MRLRYAAVVILIIFIISPVAFSNNDPQNTSTTFNHQQISSPSYYASDIAQTVYNQASELTFLQIIQDLTALGPRPYQSPINDNARDWLVSKLNNVSENKLEIEITSSTNSIVARLPGSIDNSVCFMVGGHYDTVEEAPGANDDGTGVATTIELARILSQYDWPLDIYFCLWNAEEVGLVGSTEVASQFFNNEIDILVYYNIDMLLVQNESNPSDERVYLYYTSDFASYSRSSHYTIYQDSQYWAELVQTMNYNYGTPVIKAYPHTATSSWPYSDHYPFYSIGYKSAMFFFESGFGFDTAYHTSEDTWDNPLYDYSLTEPVVASIGASIAYAQSRFLGEKFAERASLILGPYADKEFKFQSTISTQVILNVTTSSGSNLRFDAMSPMRALLGTETPGIANMNDLSVLSFTTECCGQHSIVVRNEGPTAVDVEIQFAYDSDLEGDSIPDSNQQWYNRFQVDSDYDTLNDMYEMQLGIDRFNLDSDRDTIPDNEEIYIYGTLPFSKDSDSDLMDDAWEIFYELNPLDRDDRIDDPDEDFLTNIGEYREGTSPRLNDSDFDSLLDGLEVIEYHTSPLSNDTDQDQLPDPWEIEHNLNPLVDDAHMDPDLDGKTNLEEYLAGEDPNVNTQTTIQTSTSSIRMESIIILGSTNALAVVVVLVIRSRMSKD